MKVYQTYQISDMTEGRGPMVPALCFLHLEHAKAFIDAQPGVMGIRRKWSEEDYGDWTVREIEVLEHDVIEKTKRMEALKQATLSKLTAEEREALDL